MHFLVYNKKKRENRWEARKYTMRHRQIPLLIPYSNKLHVIQIECLFSIAVPGQASSISPKGVQSWIDQKVGAELAVVHQYDIGLYSFKDINTYIYSASIRNYPISGFYER